MPGSIFLRRAMAADQRQIDALIRTVGINPMGIKWPRFIVADENGRIVGAGQVKQHGDGAREVASIAVALERQGMGIGRAIVATLVSLEPAPLFLYCAGYNEGYYVQFGFRALVPEEMPRSLRRISRVSNAILPILSALTNEQHRLVVMGRGLD
ncbi:MAG: GNAT family N-acetyltransferase [Caldilinea sp.]|nr:GNAT family N-acetyltransferase [Caldilinea sp.]